MDLRDDPVQERLAAAVDTALTSTGDLYQALAALGVPELGMPEELGGFGLGLSADVTVSQRLGYALQPLPGHRETMLVLDLLEPADVPEDALAAIITGTGHAAGVGVTGTVGALRERGGLLWGEAGPLPVPALRLVLARASTEAGATGWFLVDTGAAGCTGVTSEHLGQPALSLSFTGTPVYEVVVSRERRVRALDAARIRQAALLIGLADRALGTATRHVRRRQQYGKPLAELQTVAHRLARLVGLADGWRLLLHEAAWRHDRHQDCTGPAARLLAAATEHALAAARLCVQLHGVRGMLSHSTAATIYRIVSVEAARLGAPATLRHGRPGPAGTPAGTAAPLPVVLN
ncbi:acyl-CoA dehydrogenase family protein [Streptomyces sp. NPDC055025]